MRLESGIFSISTRRIHLHHDSFRWKKFLPEPSAPFRQVALGVTFDSYFSGRKELFEGFAIEKLEKDWTEYPVLHVDMSGGKHMEKKQLEDYLSNRLVREERKWGITEPARG